jgi:hypothetical protein
MYQPSPVGDKSMSPFASNYLMCLCCIKRALRLVVPSGLLLFFLRPSNLIYWLMDEIVLPIYTDFPQVMPELSTNQARLNRQLERDLPGSNVARSGSFYFTHEIVATSEIHAAPCCACR